MATIITKIAIDEVLAAGGTRLEIDPSAIVTSLAKDYAAAQGVSIVAAAPSTSQPSTHQPSAAEVKAAVIARLGETPANLDAAIATVMGGR